MAVLFFLFGTITYLLNGGFLRPNVLGVFVPGLLYLLTIGKNKIAQVGQIVVTTLIGCFALWGNDNNSFISLFVLSFTFHLYTTYFKNDAGWLYVLPIPYIITAFLSGWTLYHVVMVGLIYSAYTTIIFLLKKRKEDLCNV